MRKLLVIAVVLCAACAPRPKLALVPAAAERPGASIRPVYVATTRGSDEEAEFSNTRAEEVRYARLDISVPAERMLGQIELPGKQPDPTTDFVATRDERFAGAPEFRDAVRTRLRKVAGDREAIIYVHGFNNTFDSGVVRIAQLAQDFDIPGVAVHYSWPSAANPLGYVYDRDSVLVARDGLETLIGDMRAAGAGQVILVAHSVGSLLVMETLRQMAVARPGSVDDVIDGVVLISPDIDVDVFRSQARRIGDLPQPFGIFVSQRDRALRLSAQLTGQPQRLGNISNFDEVADLDVTFVDVTDFSSGLGHFTAADSPALIRIFSRAEDLETAFAGDSAGRAGLIPGTVLTVQNATAIILSPVSEISQALE